jgi:hypothetical protein
MVQKCLTGRARPQLGTLLDAGNRSAKLLSARIFPIPNLANRPKITRGAEHAKENNEQFKFGKE